MILNVSHNDSETRKKIDTEVGKPFSLMERIKLNGIGSSKLFITEASIQIYNLLILDNNRNVCNIEMRPNGILVGFRSKLESYVLVIPYHKLSIYKGKATEYSIHRDTYYIKFSANDKSTHNFIQKLLDHKLDNTPPQIEDI